MCINIHRRYKKKKKKKKKSYSISFYGFFGHDEAIGAVMSSIRLSCHEIRAFLFKGILVKYHTYMTCLFRLELVMGRA